MLSAALTPITAILALFIGYQQLRLQREQARLQIRDKRLRLYKVFRQLLGTLSGTNKLLNFDHMRFTRELAEAGFLFDGPALEAIRLAEATARELCEYANALDGRPSLILEAKGLARGDLIRLDGDGRNWAWRTLVQADQLFAKYLKTSA